MTLTELQVPQFHLAQALFQPLSIHLATRAVLEDRAVGKVYADDQAQPRIGLIWSGHHVYLGGNPGLTDLHKHIRGWFEEVLYPHLRERGDMAFELFYSPAGWEACIAGILPTPNPLKATRQYYRFARLRHELKKILSHSLAKGYEVVRVDWSLLQDSRLQNLDWLREEMTSERPSVDDFLQRSFGVALTHEEKVVGWCLSEYNCLEACEIGIATDEAHQRKGLATLMGTAFIEAARKRGITNVGWHCYQSNQPSSAAALKIGFEFACSYPIYVVWINPADMLAVHGNVALRQEDFNTALSWYQKAFACGEVQNWAYAQAACACSMLGRQMEALEYLRTALLKGYTDTAWLKTTPYLAMIRTSLQWQELFGS